MNRQFVGVVAVILGLCATVQADLNASGTVADVTGQPVMEPGEQIAGRVLFQKVDKKHEVLVRWVDTKGRVCAQSAQTVEPPRTFINYAIQLANPIGYHHRIEVVVDGIAQPVSHEFTVRYPYRPWMDYYPSVWAHYTAGQTDLVRKAGFLSTIAGRDRSPADSDLVTYVDNIVYEVFSYYHKRRTEFMTMQQLWLKSPNNPVLHHRRPSLAEAGTWETVEQRLSDAVKKHADYRPLFYNIADEIGIGDQSAVTDLDWDYSSRDAWQAYLKRRYGSLDALNAQWKTNHESWAAVRSFFPQTLTLYGQLWEQSLLPLAFGDIAKFNQTFGTTFSGFGDVVKGYRALASDDESMTATALKNQYKNVAALGKELRTTVESFEQAEAYLKKFEQWIKDQSAADTRGWNLSWWCDWRDYMDEYLAGGLGRARGIGRKYDPEGCFGMTGTHNPGTFSGHNYGKLMANLDYIMPYDIGQSFELMRGLNPDYLFMHPTWASGDQLKRALWYYLLHGCRGSLVWDNDEPGLKMIDSATGKLTKRGEAAAPVYREITAGLDRLILQTSRQNNGIAIYHSQPSIRVNWMHQNINVGRKYIVRSSGAEYGSDEVTVLRTSWIKLIEDNHLQFLFLSPEQLLEGRPAKENIRVVVLPEVWSMGDEEAKALTAFVRRGGTVIADQYTGLYDEHGRRRDKGVLDDLFGIDQSGVTGDPRYGKQAADQQEPKAVLNKSGPAIEGVDDWNQLTTRKHAMSAVAVTAEDAAFGAGEKARAGFITRQVGQGRVIFLNLDVSHYSRVRMVDAKKTEQVLAVARAALPDAIQPLARVLNAQSGKREPGTEVGVWTAGPTRKHVAVWHNIQTRQEGIGGADFTDNSIFEKPVDIAVQLDRKYHVVNLRTGENLGQTDRVTVHLSPWEPVILTLQDDPFADAAVDGPKTAKPGEMVRLAIKSDKKLQGTLQSFNIQAINPAGQSVWYYEQDQSTRDASADYAISLALNETTGTWTFRVLDAATHKVHELKVEVEK